MQAHEASLRTATRSDLPAIERLLVSSGLPTAGVADALGGFVVAESEPDKRIVGVVGLEHCCEQYALLAPRRSSPSGEEPDSGDG